MEMRFDCDMAKHIETMLLAISLGKAWTESWVGLDFDLGTELGALFCMETELGAVQEVDSR